MKTNVASLIALAALASAGPSSWVDHPSPRAFPGYRWKSGGSYRYTRRKDNPAGTKMARKAAEGKLGVRK